MRHDTVVLISLLSKGFIVITRRYFPLGHHLLIDLYDAQCLTDIDIIEQALAEAASVCGATLLDIKLHTFGENQGITGVALLAESHISIHTWPESQFAAIDVFMCGDCKPILAVDVFEQVFKPQKINVSDHSRGSN